ncbi:MAG: hypothetical protein JXB32_07490 [Deltaproteobacteria bacterium]|nr:hypothetical protein [Deltaproteobacteria bacterium]
MRHRLHTRTRPHATPLAVVLAAVFPACPAGSWPDSPNPTAAEPICGPDLNPRSATGGVEHCLPGDLPDGTALYFASVYCGHCTTNLDPLRQRMLELESEGLSPRLVWIQLGAAVAGPDAVAGHFDAAWDFPVYQDSPDGALWRAFHAEWYQLVIVDRRAGPGDPRRFGPLSPANTAGEEGDRIVKAWREVLLRDRAPSTGP